MRGQAVHCGKDAQVFCVFSFDPVRHVEVVELCAALKAAVVPVGLAGIAAKLLTPARGAALKTGHDLNSWRAPSIAAFNAAI